MTAAAAALGLVAAALARVLAPPELLSPSEWAKRHLIVPDGPHAGKPWDPALTPYIAEPLDDLDPASRVNEIAIMKSSQTGFTTLMLAAIGHSIDCDPCRMMVVQPTDSALTEFNRDKLQPVIDKSEPLRAKVRPQASRSGEGSTTYSKLYPGGSLNLGIATSAADLSGKTLKKVFNDEIDRYPDDVDNQGDPLGLIEARYLSFRDTGDWKRADVSTPTIKGASAIEQRYEAGDKRKWHVPCPHCADADGTPSEFVFTFDRAFFRFDDGYPYRAHYVTPCCGAIIEPHEKKALVRAGRWIATAPRAGAYPSYHFDTLSSPLVPWDDVAKAYLDSRGDPLREKSFANLWLGLPYEETVADIAAPAIVAAAADYPRGIVPARAALTTLAADLNGDWLEWALYAFGPSPTGGVDQWLVDTGRIDGVPTDAALWQAFEELTTRVWPFAGKLGDNPAQAARSAVAQKTTAQVGRRPVAPGETTAQAARSAVAQGQATAQAARSAVAQGQTADLIGVDTGYGTHEVYKFVRGRHKARALDGRPNNPADPNKAMPIGSPKKAQARDRFDRPLFKVWLYPVNGHELKVWLAHALGAMIDGRTLTHGLHLPREIVDEPYADQLTSEVLVPHDRRNGRIAYRWKPRRGVRNEALDLAVYARALAFGARPNGLGVDRIAPADWARLIAERHGSDPEQVDLFSAAAPPPARAAGESEGPPAPEQAPAPRRVYSKG